MANYTVGDVVVTVRKARITNSATNEYDGYADPGWKWRIIEVYADRTEAGLRLIYHCVSHDEPRAYRRRMRANEIGRKIGTHAGPLDGPKEKT